MQQAELPSHSPRVPDSILNSGDSVWILGLFPPTSPKHAQVVNERVNIRICVCCPSTD